MSPRVPKAEKVAAARRRAQGRAEGVRAVSPGRGEAGAAAAPPRDRDRVPRRCSTSSSTGIRAGVTLARPADAKLQQSIQEALSEQLGKEVIASFSVDPEILGGAVVRVGERIHDGSVRRRLTKLRRQLLISG